MKTLIALTLALVAMVPAQAQVFRPSLDGAVAGAVVGGVIGHNSGRGHAGRGAAIGAGVGLLATSQVHGGYGYSVGYGGGRNHGDRYYSRGGWDRYSRGLGWYRPSPFYTGYSYGSYGYGYPNYGYAGYGSYGYRPYSAPVIYPGYDYPRGYGSNYDYGYDASSYQGTSYRGAGALFGGLVGAIIGNNSGGRHGGRGALWGGGAGYILGAIADSSATRRPAVINSSPAIDYNQVYAPAASTAPSGSTTIINNYYNTPSSAMGAANSMFGR